MGLVWGDQQVAGENFKEIDLYVSGLKDSKSKTLDDCNGSNKWLISEDTRH